MRIDKYLWAVRLYKTRALASEACDGGHVCMQSDGRSLKPSHIVAVGEVYNINRQGLHLTVRVVGLPVARVGAPLVPNFLEDQTPDEERQRFSANHSQNFESRPRGSGRPTKRDRRSLSSFKQIG